MLTGAICLVGLEFAANAQRDSEQHVVLRSHVVALSANYLEAGLIGTTFLRKPDEKLIEKHKSVADAAQGHLRAIEVSLEQLPDNDPLRQTAALRSGLNLYLTRFQNLVSAQRTLGLNENQGLQGRLRAAVHQVESRLAELDAPRLSALMLMMRRHEKDFMLRGLEKYGDEVIGRVAEFKDTLAASGLPAAVKAELSTMIEAYKSAFMAFMVIQTSLNEEADDFATVFQRNRPTLETFVEVAEQRYRSAEARATEVRRILVWAIAAATFAIGLLALLFGQRIAGLIARMTNAMQKLAAGDFEAVLPGLARTDEVGDMARAVEAFKVKAEQKARDEADAKVELDQIEAQRRNADMSRLADEFEVAVGGIIETVSCAATKLEASAGSLITTAERSRELTTMAAATADAVSTNVQSVASATEEMSSSVNEIGRQIEESGKIAAQAVDQARKTCDHVGELADAGNRIGAIVELINTIAKQTNLLALNATIEAARAGDAGRGFSVVAFEVKALADQTANATREISKQVSGIQAATRLSADNIKAISDTIEQLSGVSLTIAAAVEKQGTATKEISGSVQRAAQDTRQVGSSIVDVQNGATETRLASSQVFSESQSLSCESSRLKAEVAKFLNSVRAA